MASRLFVGIDIGTTGTRCMVFDEAGSCVSSAYEEYALDLGRTGWVEQSIPAMLAATERACATATASVAIDSTRIASVGVSSQMCGTCATTAAGEPIRPMISWQDVRADREAQSLEEHFTGARFKAKTGVPISPQWTLCKILWLRDNEPEIFERAERWLQVQHLALLHLGADGLFVDDAECANYGLWDVARGEWDSELLEFAGLSTSAFGEVVPAGTQVGSISDRASRTTGLPVGTPLCVGAGDAICSIVGMGSVAPGALSITLGTAGMILLPVEAALTSLPEFMLTNHAVPGRWTAIGPTLSAASAYKWFRDTLGQPERHAAQSNGENVFELLNALCAQAPPTADGLLFLPYLNTAGAPRWNAEARAAFIGIAQNHGRAHMARAVMEGVALEAQDNIRHLQGHGLAVDMIHAGGGATRSPLWTQIQADVYGRPVGLLREAETTALGAAILGAVGAGHFANVDEGAGAMVDVVEIVEPDSANVGRYEALYETYVAAYEALSPRVFPGLCALPG